MIVAVLGPRGTYTELAARRHFPSVVSFTYCSSILEVVKMVEEGRADAGVVPVESMREGSVGETLDALAWCNVRVTAEIVFPIVHSLLGVRGARLEGIRQVLSHPQALSQCREFLKARLPQAELVEVSSTAKAAEQVSRMASVEVAAIGPKELAEIYGLEILAEDLSGNEENLTRFFCLGREKVPRTGRDKTSIVFYTERDRPGILYEILGEFALRQINLTKIESRPSKKVLGDYLFFIDFEGHEDDELIKEALEGVRRKTAMLKVIGSYPRRF